MTRTLILVALLGTLSACDAGMGVSGTAGLVAGGRSSGSSSSHETQEQSRARSGTMAPHETRGPEVTDTSTGEGLGFGSISG